MAVIALTVPGNKWPDFVKYFVMVHPNQTLDSTSPLSDNDWVRYRILLFARGAYEKGFTQEYEDLNGPVFDADIITLT